MLIGHLDLIFTDDFYPDDLPQEWLFDYYSNEFNALFVTDTASLEKEEILEDIEDDFCLVLDLNPQNLTWQHPNIVFWTQCSDLKIATELTKHKNICIQSDKKLDLNLNFIQIENKFCKNQFLYFKTQAVFITKLDSDDKQLAQQLKQLPQDICVIFQKTSSVNLQKAKTISELL